MSVAMQSGPRVVERTNSGWRVLRWVGIVYTFFVLAQDMDWTLIQAGVVPAANYGAIFLRPPEMRPDTARLIGVQKSAAALGLRDGDIVRSERYWQLVRTPFAGETLTIQTTTPHQPRALELTAAASRKSIIWGDRDGVLFSLLVLLPAALLALYILIKSRARPAPVMLGLGLACYALCWLDPLPPILSWPLATPLTIFLNRLSIPLQLVSFLSFAINLLEDTVKAVQRYLWVGLTAFGVAVVGLWSVWMAADLIPQPVMTAAVHAQQIVRLLADLAALGILFFGWIHSAPAERRRFTLFVIGLSCIMANQLADDVIGVLYDDAWFDQTTNVFYILTETLAGAVAPPLLAYAILKNRILDLGFALNRTLVFSVVSAILLATFGIVEWSVDQFANVQGRDKNVLIDAAIALVIFLTFHRVRDFVEHWIKTLFFRSWQRNEAALRKFIVGAAFITRKDALLNGLVKAVSRFAGGAATALYMAIPDGGFVRVAGSVSGVAKRIEENEPAMVSLRAERKPIEPQTIGSLLRASLCAPMIYGSKVSGFVLVGPKPDAADFRPDEVTLIGWAVSAIGHDLHALEIVQLTELVHVADTRINELRLALSSKTASELSAG